MATLLNSYNHKSFEICHNDDDELKELVVLLHILNHVNQLVYKSAQPFHMDSLTKCPWNFLVA
jgi:hypothetical protein